MKIAAMISRYLLGVMFLVFGLNGFFRFLHTQTLTGPGGEFMGLLTGSRYIYGISAVMAMSGIFFLAGRYVRLGLLLLGPILVNILLYHVSFDPKTIGPALVICAMWLLIFLRDPAFKREIFAPGWSK